MRVRKNSASVRHTARSLPVHPKTFIFFDKATRTHRFEVRADGTGSLPIDQAASLLAMHCVMCGQMPEDFGVAVDVGGNLLQGIGRRAQKLIDACIDMHCDVQLSQRQNEVLRGVLQHLSNKEIAARLQIGVRTAKFHVSSLLGKFDVVDRVSLAQKTGGLMSAAAPAGKLAVLSSIGAPIGAPLKQGAPVKQEAAGVRAAQDALNSRGSLSALQRPVNGSRSAMNQNGARPA